MKKEKNIVELYNDKLMAGTWIIAKGFKREHFKVLRLIEKHKVRFLRLESKRLLKSLPFRKIRIKSSDKPINEIMLNKGQTIFLGSIFRNTDLVLDFKEKLAREFVRMEKRLANLSAQRLSPEWVKNRAYSIPIRNNSTDIIKDFIDYATHQGSKSANKYYVALTKCLNSSLFKCEGKHKNMRDVMTPSQLLDVSFGDKIIEKALLEGMADSMPYKEIYQMIKKRLIAFAELIGKSDILAKQLLLEEN